MKTLAVYPGTFDPITHGHTDLVERAVRLFDTVIVAIAENKTKKPLLSLQKRVELAQAVLAPYTKAKVVAFNSLLVDFMQTQGAGIILRGLRAVSDFEMEFQLASMNRRLKPDIETLFLIPSEKYTFLSSHMVKEMASLGGDVSSFVHPEIVDALKEHYQP